MYLIAYVSTCTVHADEVDQAIEQIVNTAKVMNPKFGITGTLFFHDNQFLQIIEGKEEHLRKLMTNIENDKRHVSVEYLVDKPVKERGFSDWSMDSFRLKNGHKFDRANLANLTRCYDSALLPGGDKLVFFYKALLEEKEAAV